MPGNHWNARRLSRAGGALALAGCSAAAQAQGLQESYWAELSYFYPEISSTARLDLTGTARPGTVVKLEDDLNLDDRKGAPYLTLGMRLGSSWRLEFEYYQLNRSASRSISRQIEWGDATYPVGAQIESTFDTTVYRLSGGYSFLKQPNVEAGVSLGLHVTDFETELSGATTGSGASFRREARSTLVPLPTIGLYGSYMLSEQWRLRGKVDYLSLKYNDYDGSLLNTALAVEWRFAKHWGVGIGYRYVDYKLDVEKTDFHGEVNYKFSGPTLFVNAAF